MKTIVSDKFEYLVNDSDFNKEKETIIFIHGASINAYFWEKQLALLDGSFNVFAPQLPGRGVYDDSKYLNVENYSEFIIEFIDKVGAGRPWISGVSMGGAIVLDILYKNSDLVKGGIIINSGAKLKVNDFIFQSIEDDYPMFGKNMIEFGVSPKTDKEGILKYKDLVIIESKDIAKRDFTACSNFNFMEEVKQVDSAALILTASDDIVTPVKYGEYLRDNIKDSVYFEIKDAAHLSPLEKPEPVNEKIIEFINSH